MKMYVRGSFMEEGWETLAYRIAVTFKVKQIISVHHNEAL
jgi:hypothetical protein